MIGIGALIYQQLHNDSTLMGLINGLYPIIAPESASLPFIVFSRTGESLETKDGIIAYNVNVEILVIAGNYKSSIDIASRVHELMQNFNYNTKLANITEDVNEQDYIQTLNYEILLNN